MSRMSVRLALAFAALLAMLLAVGAYGLYQLHALTELDARQGDLSAQRQQVANWSALTRLNVARTIALAKAGSPPALTQWMDSEMKATSAQISVVQKGLETSLAGPRQKALLETVAKQRRVYLALRGDLLRRLRLPAEAAAAQAEVESRLVPAAGAYLAALEAVQADAQAEVNANQVRGEAMTHRATVVLPLAVLVALGVGSLLAWRLALSVLRPVRLAREAADRIAAGDLATPILGGGRDELGQLLRALSVMQDNLCGIVGGIRAGSESVGTATTQIASGNQDLSERTERAASSLQQTSATLAHLAQTMQQSAGSAGDAQALARAAAEAAQAHHDHAPAIKLAHA